MKRRAIAVSLAALVAWLSPVFAQNTKPVVNAGKDSTIFVPNTDLIGRMNMWGSVVDTMADGTSDPNTVSSWSKVSGPDSGFTIAYPDAQRSKITITKAAIGTWVFKLQATDGQFTVADTVRVTVIDSVPFTILTPIAGQKVAIGDSVLISWQSSLGMDVEIYLSIDDGFSYPDSIKAKEKQWAEEGKTFMWHVPNDPALLSENCYINVNKYGFKNIHAVSGKFSIVRSSPITNPRIKSGRGAGLAFSANGPRCESFLPDGRRLEATKMKSGLVGSGVRGVVVRRLKGSAASRIEIAQ